MNRTYFVLIPLMAFAGGYLVHQLATPAADATTHQSADPHGDDQHAGGEHGQDRTTITADMVKASGIDMATAGPVQLRDTLPLSGQVMLNPDATSVVKARFAGVVRAVQVQLGQQVRKGQVLALVESNDSLQTYPVTSPRDGTVVERAVNTGDTAAEAAMFVIADLGTMVAELHVFPTDSAQVHVGQTVQIQRMDGVVGEGVVTALLPTAEAATQTLRARVVLNNPAGDWKAGMAVQAQAVTAQVQVPLAVATTALQTMDDQTVVFVQDGPETYVARPVTTGRTDGTYTEILAGLPGGARYVARNSFVIKADMGKAGAAHAH